MLLVYGGLLVLTWWGFTHTPTGFIPQQDKGYLLVNVQLPDAASVARTRGRGAAASRRSPAKTPGVKHTVAISGQSILLNANAPNFGALYLMLDDFEHRTRHDLSGEAIAADAAGDASQREVPRGDRQHLRGAAGGGPGHGGRLQDHRPGHAATTAWPALQKTADKVVAAGEADPRLQGLFTSFRADTPWLELIIDRAQAKDRGVSIDDVRTTLEVDLGPYYINDFNRFGRTWQVNVQAAGRRSASRSRTSSSCKVRNDQGEHGAAGRLRRRCAT